MTRGTVMRTIEVALCWALLWPGVLESQAPALAKLIIKSTPTGATITLNGKVRGKTDAGFAVGPGRYTVTVSGAANCGAKEFAITQGQNITVNCAEGKWTE
jgi:hypothetical protein